MTTDTASLRALWKEAFGDTDALLDHFFAAAYSPSRCRTLEKDGRLAAALYWFDCSFQGEKLAYLYAIATAKPYRNQGMCHRLMEEVHSLLSAQGYAGSILVPASAALSCLYARMGYGHRCTLRRWRCAAGNIPVPLRKLSPEEYALCRRKRLPPGGVLQEGENLAYLSGFADFYAGENCLLAVSRETAAIFELLGDPSQAPGILRTLGFPAGDFRAPGDGAPFAMYRPLCPGEAPRYFGLALD
ncbi:MAG TPA: GNAT family N-acetyltransferase [Candidatus Faecousia intestinigallinarum]|nr:GNAT family N-acetyltransferase [Candidatus Faecousia intestinigallinarum]